jgi:hypothetical protein
MLGSNAWLQAAYSNPKARKPRQIFSPAEDQALHHLVSCLGDFDWNAIAHQMPGRTARQCRDRWKGYLSPHLTNDEWSAAEDQLLMEQWSHLGPRWSLIAGVLKGRSEVAIKNRWKLLCRRKTGAPVSELEIPDPELSRVNESKSAPLANWPSIPMPPECIGSTTTATQKELEAFFSSLPVSQPLSSFTR